MSYSVTIFESILFNVDTVAWLNTMDTQFDVVIGKVETVPIQSGTRVVLVHGKSTPSRITIYDEQVALMFRLKYPEAYATEITISEEKICYDTDRI